MIPIKTLTPVIPNNTNENIEITVAIIDKNTISSFESLLSFKFIHPYMVFIIIIKQGMVF